MEDGPAGPGTGVAPGRVNLIGDHTDYNGGLALPVALDLTTAVHVMPDHQSRLLLRSDAFEDPATVDLPLPRATDGLAALEPAWVRLPAALMAELGLGPSEGGVVEIRSRVPVGAGLSSSAALCVALAAALRVPLEPWAVARSAQRAEARVGADVGLMDQVVAVAARAGHAMLIDFTNEHVQQVPLPLLVHGEVEALVVHSGEVRELSGSPYGERRRQCEAAAAAMGIPLAVARPEDVAHIADPLLRRRARHVVTECRRVREVVDALGTGDTMACGRVLDESHESLRADFECSTPTVDGLVDELRRTPGVLGARMTGGGFGGCVVALAEPAAVDLSRWPGRAWPVVPSDGAAARGEAGP